MTLAPIYVIVGLFIVGVIVLLILYGFQVGPYGDVYQFKDPRTWQSVPNNTQWLTPAFDYKDTDRNVPAPGIKDVYCQWDPNRCITESSVFNALPVQTGC